ncbi:MAG: TRAP transporter substrate-binding protein DctP [Bacteriovoracaceae bacterium]
MKPMRYLITILFFMALTFDSYALRIKVGVLAPEGTSWSNNLKKLAKEIKKATDGKVKIKYYFGGAQGDEEDVLRKIRVGQLQGGVFTGKTLGEIYPDFRALEIPFNFKGDRELAKKTLAEVEKRMTEGFTSKGFANLGLTEIGSVYFVSKKPIRNLGGLKGLKIWSWQGDKLVDHFIDEMNLVGVPLSLPDVLSSLTTGIIEAAYAPPLAILALQWNTKVKYLVDFPLTYSFGAFLISQKAFKKISPEHQKKIIEISKKYIQNINDENHKANTESLAALKSSGIEFIKFPQKDIEEAIKVRGKLIKRMQGKMISKEMINFVESKRK